MKKAMLILLSVAAYTFSLNDVSVPNRFNPSTPARSSEVNANFDTLASRINQNNDTIEQKFIRFSDLESGDSILEKCRIDTARIDHIRSNPEADSMTITKADINGGTIDGTVIGANSAAAGTFTTVTASGIRIPNGGFINDWAYLGTTHNPSSPYETRWYKAYELTGTGGADEDIELRVLGDANYYYGACIVRLKITRYYGEPANQLHVTITPISGWPSNALVKVDGGIIWVASNLKRGDIYGRLVQSRYDPGRVLFNTTYRQTEPAGVSINGTFGVKTYNGDTQNVVLHNVDGANGNFTGQVNTNNINNTGFLQNTGYTASIYPLSDRSIHYRDVYQYSTVIASFTGTMKITLPKTWSSTMLTFTIKGFNFATGQSAWECVVGGQNYDIASSWRNCSAEIRGSAPFSQVRLAHDGTKCCLLLGNTSTTWSYPQVAITEVFASYKDPTGWGEPYSMSFITSEDGITNIVTPTTSIYGNNAVVPGDARIDDTLWVGTTNATKLYDGWYLEGSYLCTLSGFTSLVTCTTYYVKCGKAVTLTFSRAAGTSNSDFIDISTGLMPASIRPARDMYWKLCGWSFGGLTVTDPNLFYNTNNVFAIVTFQSSGYKAINNSFSISYLTY